MSKTNTKGIIIGVAAVCAAIGVLKPDKEVESIESSIPAYQAEYDINTEIPIDVSSLPDNAEADSAHDEAAASAEEERLAKEEEEQRLAEEKAAKEAEEQKAAEEQAAKEAETQKVVEEQVAREVEEQKLLEEQSEKEKANLPDASASDTTSQAMSVQPEETAIVEETPAPEENTATPVSEMVWLSATGEKYHSIDHCGRMNPAKARQVSLEDALNSGYGKCSKCW